jgi:predicted secreted protein
MTAKVGRDVTLSLIEGTEATLIASLTSKELTVNDEPVDITSDDDDGWRRLLEDVSGTRSVDISCEGVLKNNQVGLLIETGSDINLVFAVPTVRKYTGAFRVTSFTVGAPTAEGTTFTAQFQSSGPVTFAAAS